MMDISIMDDIHKNAIDHGWWDEERSYEEVIALIHSELSEALEEYRNGKPNVYYADGKPEGIAVELADCIIRILDYCGHIRADKEMFSKFCYPSPGKIFLPELIALCHFYISMAYGEPRETRCQYLAWCISCIEYWCKDNGIDLDETIKLKHEYNKTRPYRHGGKKI